MPIKFTSTDDAKQNFASITQDPEATAEQKTQALDDYMQAVQEETKENVLQRAQDFNSDNNVLQSRGHNVLTSEERQFFNKIVEDGGFTDEDILPKTTQERVFEDIEQEHKLLKEIGIENLGAVTEFIFSDPDLAYSWNKLFSEIDGKLDAAFREETITQLKLTAYLPIAKDMLKLGPEWIEEYVRTIIAEAMKVGLEYGYVAGRGSSKNEPVGLLKEMDDDGGVSDKDTQGELTFKPGRTTVQELKGVVKKLAEKLDKDGEVKEHPRRVEGKIVMVTNPFDTFDIKANATIQNDQGAYVTNLPFNPTTTESVFVPKGKVLFFVKGQYIAAIGGEMDVKRYKETLAMEDADLYIAKQYATGKPVDKNASQVYDLDVDDSDDDEDDEG